MGVQIVSGDIFKSPDVCWANPVNCDGRMGKGLALKFKNAFVTNNLMYVDYCNQHRLKPGGIFMYALNRPLGNLKYIANIATKRMPHDKSSLEIIDKCGDSIVDLIQRYNLPSISLPALGCGLGELEWDEVSLLLRKKLRHVKASINIYRPHDAT